MSPNMRSFCVKLLKSAGKTLQNLEFTPNLYQQHLCFVPRFPFLKERTSDELIYAQDVAVFLSNMGKLLHRSPQI